MSAAVFCAAAVLAVTGLTAGPASAAPAGLKGDFNGDGHADLAVGVPKASAGGHAGAGYVNVVWGGAGGPARSTVVSQSTAGVPGTPEAGDGFGAAVVADDLNGDGYADLVVSAPGESLTADATDHQGTVTVLLGSPTGFGAAFTAARGADRSARLGSVLAVGDYDHDGDRDLVYSAREEDDGLLLRQPGPVGPAGAAPELVHDWYFATPKAVATGDFDGDGSDELAVTFRGKELKGTYVYTWKQGKPVEQWRTSDYADSLAAADFSRDGADDLVLGRVLANPEADEDYCPVVVPGGTLRVETGGPGSGLGGGFFCVSQNTAGVPGTGEAADDFGASLAVGDVDRDGYPDLAVGNDAEAIGSLAGAGSVTVVLGGADGPDGSAGAYAFHQDTAGMPGVAERGDRFGAAVTLADFDGDGRADLAAGAPGENSATGGVWYVPAPAAATAAGARALTPDSLGLKGASGYGGVLSR
ncbi:FG-GAP and VCBS repeat-containing protein [Streptomyces sp. V3I7]|uniref:FG-GAP and VCBS repeat-containing protein n=1 Tax=Streptomyces sp. V3I7 TaxID=3042278 RepID=UPI0027D81310|nr:FG-GAP and VCBS repeat-containing protein [Streptomyces sp. V3I7]